MKNELETQAELGCLTHPEKNALDGVFTRRLVGASRFNLSGSISLSSKPISP